MQRKIKTFNVKIIGLLSLLLAICLLWVLIFVGGESAVAEGVSDGAQETFTDEKAIKTTSYLLDDNSGYYESEDERGHLFKDSLINLSVYAESEISQPEVQTGKVSECDAYGVSGQRVAIRLSYNYGDKDNLLRTTNDNYSISDDTYQSIGDYKDIGIIGKGALLFQKKNDLDAPWEWQTKDGETKKDLHTFDFTETVELHDYYKTRDKYILYTPSGEDLSRGVYIKITFAYELKKTTVKQEKNWLGVWKDVTDTTYYNILEVAEFYMVQNSGAVLFHNASNFGQVGEESESGAISIDDFDTILDGDVTLNGFRLDTLGVDAYEITYKRNDEAISHAAVDGQFFLEQGRYDFTIKTKLGKIIQHTVFIERREVNDAVIGYFGQTLFTPNSKRIYTNGQYPAYVAGAEYHLNETDGTVSPIVGKLYRITEEDEQVEEHFIKNIVPERSNGYATNELSEPITEVGQYKAEFWNNPKCLEDDAKISGDVFHFVFRFQIVAANTKLEPSVNEAYLNGLIGFSDLNSKYYSVAVPTKGKGNAVFAFADYGGAYDFAYDLERENVKKTGGGYDYKGNTYTTQFEVLGAIDLAAKERVGVGYFDATDPESYQTADIAGENLSDLNYDGDIIVFNGDIEQEFLKVGTPFLNGRKYRYLLPADIELNGASPVSEGVLPFAFVKVDDFETQTISLTSVNDPQTQYDIDYGTSVEYQLGLFNAPSGKYKVKEHNANDGDSEYEAVYIKPGDMTASVNVSLFRDGDLTECVFDKNNLNTVRDISGFIINSITNELDPYGIVKIKNGGKTSVHSIYEVSGMRFSDGGAYDFTVVDRLGNAMSFALVITSPVGEANIHLQLENSDDDVQTEYSVFVGQEIDLPTPQAGELYVFDGWLYDDSLITNGKFTPRTVGDLYVWPQFTQKYTYLNFNADGGASVGQIKAEIGKPLELPVTQKEGWAFGGWEYGGNIYTGSYKPTTTSPTFNAVWNYIESDIELYDGNLFDVITANVGDKVILPFPTRTGYTFFGWRLDLGNGGNKIYYGQITKLENRKYIRLDALWIRESDVSAADLENGVGGRTAIHFIDGALLENDSLQGTVGTSISLPKPTRAGFVFVGWIWRTTPISGKIFVGDTLTVPDVADGKVVFEALWMARAVNSGAYVSGTINENNSGGDIINSISDFVTGEPISFACLILSVVVAAMIAVKLTKKRGLIAFKKQPVSPEYKKPCAAPVNERSDYVTRQREYKTRLNKQQRLKAFITGLRLNPLSVTVCTALFMTVIMALTGVMGSWERSAIATAETVQIVDLDQNQSVVEETEEQYSGATFTVEQNAIPEENKDSELPNNIYTKEEMEAAKEQVDSVDQINVELSDDEAILFGLIMLNLYSLGYDVLLAYAQVQNTKILGYAYTDFNSILEDKNDGSSYCGAGFVAFPNQRSITDSDIKDGIKIFDTSLETELNPNDYAFFLSYSENFGPCCYIANGKFIKYFVNKTDVIYEACNADEVEFKPEDGPVYSYDLGKIIYDPELGKQTDVKATSINTLLDPVVAENEYNRYIAEQTANGYTVDTMNFVYISFAALEAYYLSNQDESLLGIDVQEFYDMERTVGPNEYYTVDEDGNLTKLEFPVVENESKANWLDRLFGAVISIGVMAVGVVIVAALASVTCGFTTATAPYIMGAFIGAGMELFMQTVIQGTPIRDINWLRVGVAAVSGVLSAIPGVGWIGAGLIQGTTEAAMTAVEGGTLEEVFNSFALGFITGVVIHGVGKALSKIKFCFVAGTPVLMAAGYTKAIENVRPGDTVKSYNQITGKIENKRVIQTFENETDEIVTVAIDDGQEIRSTPGHKFYANNRWIAAEDLRAGDILVSVNGEKVVVEQVQHEILEEPIKVYNFEVRDNNTYIVGKENGVVVHNTACNKKINANGEPYETHHIASDKSIKSKFTEKYKVYFDNADMKFSDEANLVDLPYHHGAHTKRYKKYVLDRIIKETDGQTPHTKGYADALRKALLELKAELIDNKRLPYIK